MQFIDATAWWMLRRRGVSGKRVCIRPAMCPVLLQGGPPAFGRVEYQDAFRVVALLPFCHSLRACADLGSSASGRAGQGGVGAFRRIYALPRFQAEFFWRNDPVGGAVGDAVSFCSYSGFPLLVGKHCSPRSGCIQLKPFNIHRLP